MDLTPGLRYRLAKDFQLPISLFEDKHYNYYKNLYDSFFKVSEKEDLMKKVVDEIANSAEFSSKDNLSEQKEKEHKYFQYASKVNEDLKEIVRNSKAYEMMNNEQFTKEATENVEKRSIYINDNLDKRMISVDLNKANFNVFGLYGLKEELGIQDYAEFVKLATPYDYFIQSRMTRQVVFGDLNPKRQQNIQKRIINEFAKILKDNEIKVTSSSSDEIIIDPNGDESLTMHVVKDLLKDVAPEKQFFRVEEFSFTKIHPANDLHYFFKTSVDTTGKVKEEFKNVPSLYFPQVFKHKFNMPLQKEDLFFVMEGKLACFLEPVLPKVENTPKIKLK